MKIQEFRDKLKQCKREDVEKIASELYKMLPKSKKEENADFIIEEIISGNAVSASNKNKNSVMDFETLKNQINIFLENVDNDYYYAPNQIVPKSKRSKWRFEVKNFIKMINKIPADGENGKESAKLLRELYKRLAYGCGYYIFHSEDPFQSIGIRQPDFYDMLVKRTFATGFTDENLRNMLEDATTVFIDRNSLYIELEAIYAKSLPTSDLKYKALMLITECVQRYEAEIKAEKKDSNRRYFLQCGVEEMCETMLIISLNLCEPEDAIKYYWRHVHDSNKEVTLYKILDTITHYGDEKIWISVYEDGLKNGIEPRNSLKNQYQEIKESLKSTHTNA